ncbi:MAG: cupin domain-containing protein [Planctomycetes bacterium]|nr:cupin domain-containing protein [Planctomycetota bacterium]NOG53228.1 cupin domain-containing protein [Planctomycetota bacterium]
MHTVNLNHALSQIEQHWQPHIVGELNDQHVRLAKLSGEFIWHAHENADELFLVLHGRLEMQFRDRTVRLDEGEFIIVPRGVEHCPRADQECHVLLFEPAETLNTGDVTSERTVRDMKRI